MATVRYSFALNAIEDDDVIHWLELQPNTSAAIRSALKAYVSRATHTDLLRKIDEVLNAVNTLRYARPIADVKSEGEPERAAKGLDAMLGKFGDRS